MADENISIRPFGRKFQVLDGTGLILRTLDNRSDAELFAAQAGHDPKKK